MKLKISIPFRQIEVSSKVREVIPFVKSKNPLARQVKKGLSGRKVVISLDTKKKKQVFPRIITKISIVFFKEAVKASPKEGGS